MRTLKRMLAAALLGTSFLLGGCEAEVRDAVLAGSQATATTVAGAVINSFFGNIAAQN
jgi:hypothetical protein